MRHIIAAAILLLAAPVPAFAHAKHHRHHHPFHHRRADARSPHSADRPQAWCGWYMRKILGVGDAAYNLARNWAHFGARADGPCVGCVVVWPHHVGIIRGRGSHGWIVESGNDGHAVRRRERSVSGAIAFREPG